MKKVITLLFLVFAVCFNIQAVDVCVTMNTVSPIMELRLKGETELIEVGDPESRKYNFSANVGTYELTAYSSDDKSVCNGTIDIVITEEDNQIFSIYTITTYATNSGWEYDTDYSINCEVSTREGNNLNFTIGDSSTAGRKTFLVLGGNSYYIELLPSSKRKEEGYSKFIKTGTIMSNVNVFGAIPLGKLYVFTTPDSASLYLGIKKANYIDFINVEKENIKTENGKTKHYYWLSTGQVYNYRVSQKDKLTHGGYFTLNATTPELEITEEDMDLFSPKTVLHDVKSNNGYNVGNILLNINEKGYLKLSKDETYSLIAYRDWQLTDNTFNNYYIDPDYHYNVTDLNGVTDSSVITIDEKGIIKAVGKGSAIVTVTYDAISLSYYTTTHAKADYLGGPFWGAIWPENTGAFIVSVDEKASEIVSNMNINNSLNLISNKLSGDKIDAEHDVLYYLENEEGYYYTFTPENVATVSVAYPEFGENTATYKGFENSDVKLDEDGSYTVKLKFGRNIIKLTDNNDGSDYQILTAKPIKYSIENGTNPGEPFQPGDQINVQFEGLYHPANKMAGIYNMNAVIKYNDIPVGSDINSSTANQYQFGSTETAQLYKVTIPEDWNTDSKYLISGGAISMSGFGDAYGSHRLVSPTTGRYANFTASQRAALLGTLPNISVDVQSTQYYKVIFKDLPENAAFTVKDNNGTVLTPDDNNYFIQSYGVYNYDIICEGYKRLMGKYSVTSGSPEIQELTVSLELVESYGWDGKTFIEPSVVSVEESEDKNGFFYNKEGYYKIASGYNFAWFANEINNGNNTINAILINDIDLCNFDWTPIGISSNRYNGKLFGNGYSINELYINNTSTLYQGLFSYIENAEIRDLSVLGTIKSNKNYTAGIVANATNSIIEGCHSGVDITSSAQYSAGIVSSASLEIKINKCSNSGNIISSSNYAAGIVANMNVADTIKNCYNIGKIEANAYCAGISANISKSAVIMNCYNIGDITKTSSSSTYHGAIKGHTTNGSLINNYCSKTLAEIDALEKTDKEFENGDVAWLLGESFGQKIGSDYIPLIAADKVYKVYYMNNLDDEVDSLYTNSLLPENIKDTFSTTWYNSKDGEVINDINSDSNLYVLFKDITAPTTPLNLEVIVSELSITVNWESAFDNVEIAGYNIYIDDVLLGNTEMLSYEIKNLISGKTYKIDIEAVDIAGNISPKSTIDATTNILTGLNSQINISVNIYPNPFNDCLNIQSAENVIERIDIFDILGKSIYSYNPIQTYNFTLKTSDWKLGIYIVRVKSNNRVINYKVVKE